MKDELTIDELAYKVATAETLPNRILKYLKNSKTALTTHKMKEKFLPEVPLIAVYEQERDLVKQKKLAKISVNGANYYYHPDYTKELESLIKEIMKHECTEETK